MHMTTSEAVWAATAGGAIALRRTDVGYVAPGAKADLVMLDAPSHSYLAYRPGVPLVHAVYRSGTRLGAGYGWEADSWALPGALGDGRTSEADVVLRRARFAARV
jgi:Amidohydrolase family